MKKETNWYIIDKINVRMLTCSVLRRTTTWPVLHLTSIRFNKTGSFHLKVKQCRIRL